MKRKLKIVLNSLLFTSLMCSGVALSVILSSCSNSNPKQQEFKNNEIVNNILISNLNLQEQTKTQFYNLYSSDEHLLKKMVSDNLSTLLSGPTEQVEANFTSKLVFNNNEIYINLVINPGFWYKNNSLVLDLPLSQDILLTGFKKELTPDEGGTYNGLSVNTHLKLVDVLLAKLSINPSFNISNLNKQKLNDVYKTSKFYNELNCEILDGSNTKEGILLLKINGTYENVVYSNVEIKISGFKGVPKISKSFINNINLDLNQWFSNLQPTQTIKTNEITNISSQDFINKYILSASISYIDPNNDIRNFMSIKDALLNNYLINFHNPIINKDSKSFKLLTESIRFQTKKYVNNDWINGDLIDISVNQQPNLASIDIPTNKQALEFLLDSTKINESVLETQYASYFKAQAMNAKSINVNYPQIPNLIQNEYLEKIKNTYYPNNKYLLLNLSNESDTFYINDIERRLEFVAQVSIDDGQPLAFKRFNFINKTKNLLEFVNQNLLGVENHIVLKNNEQKDWGYKIIQRIKKQYKNNIDSIFSDATAKNREISVDLISSPISNMNNVVIYSNDGSWNINNQNLLKLKENSIDDSTYVFNKQIIYEETTNHLINLNNDGQLNIASGLFRYNANNIFMVNSIHYEVANKFTSLFATYVHENAIILKFPFKTIVSLNNKTIEETSWVSVLLTKTKWESIN